MITGSVALALEKDNGTAVRRAMQSWRFLKPVHHPSVTVLLIPFDLATPPVATPAHAL